MADVEIERHSEAIAILRLNRPETLNALSWNLIEELHAALDGLDADNRCRVILLTGAGRGFCSGLDLRDQANPSPRTEGARGPRAGLIAQQSIASLIPKLRRTQQVVIAAVNGAAYGGGLALALGSDLRIASESARFCVQFIKLGVSGCDIGVSYLLPRLIGAAHAHDLILTSRSIDAAEARGLGIVSRVTPDDKLLDEALSIAEGICDFTPGGVTMTKEVMWANLDAPNLEAAIHLENRTQILCGMSGDLGEAAKAFLEKRKPSWD